MSKESSIKVFAENARGTRPANAIPVWVDNISAIGGGGSGSGGNPEVESYVTDNSGKIDSVCTTYQSNSANYLTAHQTIPSAKWEDASDCVQTNSANWAGGVSDTFYIYPGKTTDKEISENSGKDLKLYNSANNVFLDFAGKSTLPNYTIFNFKEITGTQYNQNTLQHLRLKVYPNATSACKVFDTNTTNLLDSNTHVNQALTAYYDAGGNSLAETRSELNILNSFVQSNSANWEGGSAHAGEGVLFHFYHSNDPINESKSYYSWVSGATELYFEATVESHQGLPNDVIITRHGDEIGRAYWTQVSSDAYYDHFTASYINSDGGEIQIQNMGYMCDVSANGAKTDAFYQGYYICSTGDKVKFNVQGYNVTGQIYGYLHGESTPLTSFTGNLTDFTAKGYDKYQPYIHEENGNNSYSYELSAEFGAGGSTVASGDVFPPTNNLDPYSTYYLGWNANNGGLFWYQVWNDGN